MNEDDLTNLSELTSELLSQLNFCGCRIPESGLVFLHAILDNIHSLSVFTEENPSHTMDEFINFFGSKQQELRDILISNIDGVLQFVYSVLEEKRITEHGGSLPGWIKDHEFKSKLDEFIRLYEMRKQNDS